MSRDDPAGWLARAADLAPWLEERGRATDVEGLSPDCVARLEEAGLLRLTQPPSFGGAGAEPAVVAAVLRLLARGCAATAAFVAAGLEGAARLAALSDEAQKEVWGAEPQARLAIARIAEQPQLSPRDSGEVLNGRWRAVGGMAHAQWVWLVAPAEFAVLVPVDSLLQAERAQLGGLRGLGWADVGAHDLAVPARRVHRGGEKELFPAAVSGLWSLAMVLGTAEGAYEDYVRATRARVSGIGRKAVAGFTQVQARVAESQAELKAVGLLFDQLLEADGPGGAEMRRDMAFISRQALEAVTRLVRQMGAMGLVEGNPVQRRYRDLRTLAAAGELRWDEAMAARGRQILGIEEPIAASEAA